MPHTPYMMHLHFTNPTNTVTSHLVYTLLMHPYSILWWILYSIECANIPCLLHILPHCHGLPTLYPYLYYTLLSINLLTLCLLLHFQLSCLHLTKVLYDDLVSCFLTCTVVHALAKQWIDKQWVATWSIRLRKVMECLGFCQNVLDFGNL